MGYKLFRDESTLKTRFVAADVFDPESNLKQLDGQMSIIYASAFLHLFDSDNCVKAVHRIVKLFRDEPGCLFIGGHLGRLEAGPLEGSKSGTTKYRHNVHSFTEMWTRVGEETGTKWEVDAFLHEEDLYATAEKRGIKAGFLPPGSRWLNFSVRRVA